MSESNFRKVLALAERNPEALNDGRQNGSFWSAIIQEDGGVDSQRRYSQSGNDQDEIVNIKNSRVSCYIFSIFMNNLIQWRKSDAGLAKAISDLFQTLMLF